MTSAAKQSKISLPQFQHLDCQVLSEQVLSSAIPLMLLIDVLGCARHAADELSPELLEHICDCEECLAVSVIGASGSPFCHQRPDRVSNGSEV
jgi:hypothetical protein